MLNTSLHPGFSQWCFTIAAECFSLVSLVPRGTYRSLCSAPRQIGDAVLDPSQFAGTRRTWKGPERTKKNRRGMTARICFSKSTVLCGVHPPPLIAVNGFLGYLLLPFSVSLTGAPVLHVHQAKNITAVTAVLNIVSPYHLCYLELFSLPLAC